MRFSRIVPVWRKLEREGWRRLSVAFVRPGRSYEAEWQVRDLNTPGRDVVARFDHEDDCRFWLKRSGFMPTCESVESAIDASRASRHHVAQEAPA